MTEPTAADGPSKADRSWFARVWYELVRAVSLTWFSIAGGIRATGMENLPARDGVLMVSNHLSFLDVFVLGIPLKRRLNYVARSTLFKPLLGPLIRSVGGFPIQIEGKGASGLKETLKRLRQGAVVVMFPEGARSYDGRMTPLKPGIAVLAGRGGVPVVPTAVAGTFEAWPRTRPIPGRHAIRIVYGPPIAPEELRGQSLEFVTSLISDRMAACRTEALQALARDLAIDGNEVADALVRGAASLP
ncbi:MAG: lysophospholipid acyltransferase family protein [Isosphaeraceae bacterium]